MLVILMTTIVILVVVEVMIRAFLMNKNLTMVTILRPRIQQMNLCSANSDSLQ